MAQKNMEEHKSARTVGSYVGHLSALEASHGVVAHEDIYSERGTLLVKKGAPIRPEVAERLRGHTLQKPVEDLVVVGRSIQPTQIHDDVLALLQRYPDLEQIHRRCGFADGLRHLFFVRSMPHALLQHLTVMRARLAKEYQHTLFTAWFGALIADEMRLPALDVYSTFVAALFKDIGLLHLEPELLTRTDKSDAEADWRYGQHVLVAKNTIERTGLYEAPVAQAVAQHHERCDGTGFPFGLAEDKLGSIGQILAICEALFFLRSEDYEPKGKTLAAAVPFLRINARTHFYPIFRAVYGVLLRSGLPMADAQEPALGPEKLLQSTGDMQRLLIELVSVSDCLANAVDSRRAESLQRLTSRIMEVSHTSGLVTEQTLSWLGNLRAEEAPACAADLKELSELQLELLWLVKRAHRKAREALDEQLQAQPDLGLLMAPLLSQFEADLGAAWAAMTPQLRTDQTPYR